MRILRRQVDPGHEGTGWGDAPMRAYVVRTVADDPAADVHGAPDPCARLPLQPSQHLCERINGWAYGSPRGHGGYDDSACANGVNSSEEVSMDYSDGATHRPDRVPAFLRA